MNAQHAIRERVATDAATPWLRWLALGGAAGPVLFFVAFTVAGLLRPGYSPLDQPVSDLGIGDNAWLVNIPLILLGPALTAFAIAFYGFVRVERRSLLGLISAVLLAAVGLGFAAAGTFPETDSLHWTIGAPLAYGGAVFGFAAAGMWLVRTRDLRGWGKLFLAASAVALVTILLTFYTFATYQYGPGFGPSGVGHWAGLMERLALLSMLVWYAIFGWKIYRTTASHTPRHG